MKIVAIIVTYNAMKWIDRCLLSLRNSYIPIETIVIDNSSTDGTRQYIPSHYPEVVWMPQEENLGFGQANNIGLRYTLEHDADFALLLNQDAYINREMLIQLLRYDDKQSILSPVHLNGQGDDFDSNFRQNTIKRNSNISNLKELREGYNNRPFLANAAAAACWFIPACIIRKVGGFNPLFFQYGEDHNYLDRVFYHGFQLKVVPTTFAYHQREQFGNKHMYQKRVVYRYLLLRQTDINREPSLKDLLNICGFWCREGVRNHKPFRFIGQSINGLFKVFCNRALIKHSRKIELEPGTTWL